MAEASTSASGAGAGANSAAAGGSVAAASGATLMRNVPVLLRTSIPGASIPLTPYLVPTSWRRTHLSTLVNRVLRSVDGAGAGSYSYAETGAGAAATPFDFIVDGALLRGLSLGEYLAQSGKDAETTLEIEYVRSTLPPRFQATIPQDDWVSAVDARGCEGIFLTSSYDGTLRLFPPSSTGVPLYSLKAAPAGSANGALSSAVWLPAGSSSSGAQPRRIATAGMDGVVRLFELPASALELRGADAGADASASRKARLLWSGAVHAPASSSTTGAPGLAVQPLSSVSASANGRYVLSAGWDGCVGVWDVAAGLSSSSSSSSSSGRRAQQGGDGMDVDEFDTQAQRAPDAERDADDAGLGDGELAGGDYDDGDDEDGTASRKRRKAAGGKRARTLHAAAMGGSHAPDIVLRHAAPQHAAAGGAGPALVPGSNARVSRAIFERVSSSSSSSASSSPASAAAQRVFSAGWNGSVKQWDVGAGGLLLATKAAGAEKAITDIAQLALGGGSSSAGLLASAHMDRSLGLWDFRTSSTGSAAASSIAVPIPNAHAAPVQAVAAHPTAGHLLASASLDGTVNGWDVRSSKAPLFVLTAPPVPLPAAGSVSKAAAAEAARRPTSLLCVDWTPDGQAIVAGGQDCRVSVWQGQGIGAQELVLQPQAPANGHA